MSVSEIIMPISEKGLRNKAKKRELESLQKNKINSELIPAFVEVLNDVYVTSRPKEIDYHNRNDLIRIFNEVAKEIYGKCNECLVVEEFGSFSMDLFSKQSDLDLSVNFGDGMVEFPREKKIQALRKFAKKFSNLQKRGHVSGIQPIYFANVPILKVTDNGTGIECDISIENRDGVVKSKIVHLICSIDKRFHMLSFLGSTCRSNQKLIDVGNLLNQGDTEFIDMSSLSPGLSTSAFSYLIRKKYYYVFKAAKVMISLSNDIPSSDKKISGHVETKAWAKAHGINSSKDRTLNSLSIISLVAFHLQTRNPPILPPFSAILKDGPDPSRVQKLVSKFTDYGKKNQESVGELFVTLLIKLASVETLWSKGLCASPYEGTWMLKHWEHKYAVMSVEDFTDRSQNVARAVGSGEVKMIYQCIQRSLKYINSFMDGKIQAKKLCDVLFGREGIVGNVRSSGSLEGIHPIPFTAILQKLGAIGGANISQPIVWGGPPIEGWPSENKQQDNLVGKQNLEPGKRMFEPSDNVEPVMKKMRNDGSPKGTTMEPISFAAVLKTIGVGNASTKPDVVSGGAATEGWPGEDSSVTTERN